jgi:AAA domain, putative AbiEii toxin, Type IV TA system
MNRIFFENVRCFITPQSAPLRPLTLLVGENSSGKSTFLALVRLAWDLCQGLSPLDLNEAPFLLGAYDQVASFRRGRGGRAQQFCIGGEILSKGPPRRDSSARRGPSVIHSTNPVTVKGSFVRKGGQPHLLEWVLEAAPLRIEIISEEPEKPPRLTVQSPSGSIRVSDFPIFPQPLRFPLLLDFLLYSNSSRGRHQESLSIEGDTLSTNDLEVLQDLAFALRHDLGRRPYAFAPIRTSPKRTYDPLKEIPDPEGSHVPMILAKSFTSDPRKSAQLRSAIDAFGQASGLFTDIDIRRIGRKEGDPFQLQVKIAGSGINLVDVGYGVSQVLPIIVDAIREPPGSTFLLQQPEVHLHPRAQAELGSFLATLAKQQQKRFIVETHSDYLVDRIRMDIRDGKQLKPSDVAILYFERMGGAAQVRTMKIDDFGNLVDVPPGYRQFFLEEERRMLSGY